jgi:secreted trypsin-like serine protease
MGGKLMCRHVARGLSRQVACCLFLFQAGALDAQDCARPREGIGRPKIVGGLLADTRDWPWQVALRLRSPANGQLFYFCGATVITPTAILTAAHCVTDFKGDSYGWMDKNGSVLEAVIGLSDLKQVTPANVRRVSAIHVHETYAANYPVHEDYTAQTVGNDIAVLTLADSWSGPYARLSLSPQTDPRIPPGAMLAVAGYGLQVAEKLGGKIITYKQKDGTPFTAGSDRLQEVGVDLVSESACRASRAGARVPNGQFCAGSEYGGHDSCSGDSGGALVAFDSVGCTYQVGIVSAGPADCAQAQAYGLYTRVSDFSDWLRKKVPETRDAGEIATVVADASAPRDAVEAVQAQLTDLLEPGAELATLRINEGAELKLGSTLTIQVSSEVAGNLILIDIDARGGVTQLYPNRFSRGRGIGANQTLVIDGSEAGFVFRAQEPVGNGRLIAIVGPQSFDPYGLIGETERNKAMAAEAAPVTYLSQLVQLIGRVRNAGPSLTAGAPSWAMATLRYAIKN